MIARPAGFRAQSGTIWTLSKKNARFFTFHIFSMEGDMGPRHFGHIAGFQDEEEALLGVDVQYQRQKEAVMDWVEDEDHLTGVAAFLSPANSLLTLLSLLEPSPHPTLAFDDYTLTFLVLPCG